jgi:hypothetical protein
MSYDSRKAIGGQEYVEEVEMILDACKYTLGDYLTKRSLQFKSGQPIFAGDTGNFLVVNTPVAWNTLWGTTYTRYGKSNNSGEIFSFIPVSAGTINITGRGLFGTTDGNLGNHIFKIMHKGEADGTCRGYPFNCSDVDSYDQSAKRSFIFSTGNNAGGIRRFAGLRKITHNAGEVDPGESIGTRASLSFEISNGVHNDYDVVPYPEKQTSNGTFWGKMQARHPYFQGREVIYRAGLRDANTYQIPDFIERRFIMDSANLSNEKFTVTALDPVILTEDKKAQMPVTSPATLSAAITGSPATFSYINAANYYFGAMAATVFVRIDSEIIKCTVSGATTLTVVTRGYKSASKDHDAGASIQDCIVFTGTHGINAITFALQNYTKIPAGYIGSYASVIALLPAFTLSEAIISKPMPVSDFINYLVQLGNLIFKYDEETQKIAIEYTPELSIQPITVDQKIDIKEESVSVDTNIKNQFTRFAYLFAPVDVTKDQEENYAIRYLSANVSLESAQYLGQVNEKKTVKNTLLTKSSGDALLATSYVSRVLQNNLTIPKIINLTIDASKVGVNSGGNLKTGSIVSVSTKYNEDKDGNALAELYQVLKLTGNAYNGFKAKLRRYQSLQPSTVNYVIGTGGINYDLSAHYAPAAGNYIIYINPDVIFGSYDTSLPAFTTGSQAVGVSFKIIHRGKILGMGGAGGDCGIYPVFTNASAGLVGGTAFNATVPCDIDCGSGLIWAGGGGGGGSNQGSNTISGFTYEWAAEGGGGGQGYGESIGGLSTYGGDDVSHSNYDHNAENGNQAGAGLYGGLWGENGDNVQGYGGLAGYAIKKNGNAVNIIAGDNDLNIKGRRV